MNLKDCYKQNLLKKVRPDPENAKRSIEQSSKSLGDANKNFEIECYNVVIILSYTSMFHAARALLFNNGIKERSHLCIPIYIKAKYPELIRFANMLDSYRMFRHRTVYGLGVTIDKAEAEEALDAAEEFLDEIEKIV